MTSTTSTQNRPKTKQTRATTNPRVSKQKRQPTDQDLTQFCIAVREKQDWEQKIWDEKLALKWAIEAELAPLGSTVLQGEALEAIQELRRGALLRKLDQDIVSIPASKTTSQENREPISGVDHDLKTTLKYARGSEHALWEPELREKGLGVFVSDDLIPESVHRELVRELDILAAKEPKDFHPHSFGKVQDLIHPSLYPYVAEVTPVFPGVKLPPIDEDGKFRTEISTMDTDELTSSFAWIPSVFKVSPDGTDVHIESYINGLGTRDQYPDLFRVIEKMFLLALPHFEKTTADSERYKPQTSPSVARWIERRDFASMNEGLLNRKRWEDFLVEHEPKWDSQKRAEREQKEKLREETRQEKLKKDTFYTLGDELVSSDMYKEKNLKVIVKAANYTLTPGREYKGTWHMEGMPHERIVASVIYYYDTDDSIEDGGLSFRKFRDISSDFPGIEDSEYRHEDFSVALYNVDDDGNRLDDDEDEDAYDEQDHEDNYPSDWETRSSGGTSHPIITTSIPSFIELGTVPTTNFDPNARKGTGRMLSFPNWLQHKVESVKNISDSGNAVATRKILCFFLVDDTIQNEIYFFRPGFSIDGLENMNVLTTSEVPNQMRTTNEPTIRAFLPTISTKLTGYALPPELVDIICRYIFQGTLTREEAEGYRLQLMNDRKVRLQERNGYPQTYSLCEH